MEKLKNIKLLSSKIEVNYAGIDASGKVITLSETMTPAPEWVAVLLRYLADHKQHGLLSQSARSINLQGSFSEFPTVAPDRWNPNQNFNG